MDNKSYIKIGDIELVYSDLNKQEEVIQWFDNDLYGKAGDYVEFPEDHNFMVKREDAERGDYTCRTDKKLFEKKQLCFVIAFIEWNRAHDEMDVSSVGRRPWELDETNKKWYDEIINWAFDHQEIFEEEYRQYPQKYTR